MRIVAIGRTDILYNSILEIAKSGHQIVTIITSEPTQYQYSKGIKDFQNLSEELGSDFVLTENLLSDNIIKIFEKCKPDIAISVNWNTLIPKEILGKFTHGVLNAHAGDLPRYRGNAVRNWAIVSGESHISLTIHQMASGLDSGPILMKKSFPIGYKTCIGDLYNFVEENTPSLFVKSINGLAEGSIVPKSQDQNNSLRCYPRLMIDSEVNWSHTAEKIDRIVRASSEPFSGAYSYINGEKIIIWKSSVKKVEYEYLASPGQVIDRDSSGVTVATGEDFLLIEDAETITDGRVPPTKIINTIRVRLGLDYSNEIQNLKKKLEVLERRLEKYEN